jgi:pimeloyl-ACP methyl ester carboxylesterase
VIWLLRIPLLVLLALSVWIAADLRAAYSRIGPASASEVVRVPLGVVEFQRGGADGTPVLVIHGSGGGFDQGALIAQAVLGDKMRWIAPSRFGYLRSTLPPQASFDDQAEAYAQLLDALGLSRVPVVAMSHGGPSALLFAARHPQRVGSLTLLSCGVASSTDAAQAVANKQGEALVTVFRYDLLYWAASHLQRQRLMTLMGADAQIIARLDPGQRQLVERVIDLMNPVAPRASGVLFDNRAALPNERIAAIRAPTLILHARDDTLQLYRNAEYAARRIPGARLRTFDRGGHLLIAVEQPAVREAVQRFVREHEPR